MKYLAQRVFCFLLALLAVLVCAQAAPAAKGSGGAGAPRVSAPPEQPFMNIPQVAHNFGEVLEGTEVMHDFAVKNKGTGVLNIERVKVG